MAKGYPTREVEYDPTHHFALPEDACIICKKRRAAKAGVCAHCDAILAGPS